MAELGYQSSYPTTLYCKDAIGEESQVLVFRLGSDFTFASCMALGKVFYLLAQVSFFL